MAQHIETPEQLRHQVGLAKKAVADLESKWEQARQAGTERASREALKQLEAGRRYRDSLLLEMNVGKEPLVPSTAEGCEHEESLP